MNFYPSWIHRIPEMLEALALLPDERIDRRRAEELFDLRRSAAHELLRRFGAERCGNSLAIGRARLMARLREMQERPDWRWERERREQIRARIDTLRPNQRRSLVPVGEALQQRIDLISIAGLPDTVRFAAGRLTIHCRDMEHLVEQLVLVAKALDTDYEAMRLRVESAPARPVRYCGHAAARSSSQAG
jgi:hypothetical protein